MSDMQMCRKVSSECDAKDEAIRELCEALRRVVDLPITRAWVGPMTLEKMAECKNTLSEARDALAKHDMSKGSAVCQWTYDECSDCWESACGNAFVFAAGGPVENEMAWCPYCGKKLEEEEQD